MPAAGVVMIIAVVADRRRARLLPRCRRSSPSQKITSGLDEAISGVVGIIEKSEPVNEVVTTINQNLDAGVDLLEGLLVKKAGMEDAMGLLEGLYPGAAAEGLRNFPESKTTKAPRISEVYTKGTLTLARLGREAPIAAASPNGPALRNPAYGSLAARALYPEGRQTTARVDAALAGHRHRLARAVRAERVAGRAQADARRRRRGWAASAGTASRADTASRGRTRQVGPRLPAPVQEGQLRARGQGDLVQTPAPFDYERATSVDGAIASLQEHGPEARLIAGGHSLLPMMKLRLANPEFLIDINDLDELSYIDERMTEVRIGALTRHAELLESELLARRFPVFRDAEDVIADPVVRNRGTIGGSLCQADAAEDLSAVCAALKAQVVIGAPTGHQQASGPSAWTASTSGRSPPRSAPTRC